MSGPVGQATDRPLFFYETRRPAEEKAEFFSRLRAFTETQQWSRPVANEIELILEEWLADVISYGIATVRDPLLRIEIFSGNSSARIVITDNGIPFDPTQLAPPDVNVPAEERPIGGLGIFMMKKLSSAMRHERQAGRNILWIEKDLLQPVLTKSAA
jgi:serine/threonine-protein kinase RsbW